MRQRLATRTDFRVVAFDNRQYDYISWNSLRAPFDDPEIRRALTLAIDRQALIDALFKGYARVASSPIPSNIWAHDPALRPLPYDPAAARRILAQKGYRDVDGDGIVERNGRPFAFELTTNSSNRIRTAALVMIQEQLRQVGVAATPRTIEIHALTEANTAHEYDATVSGWAIDTTLDLKPYFHSSASAGGYNFGSYRNDEVDRLLEAARRAATPESALPDLLRLQQILHAEQPYTFLWEPQRLCAVRADLIDVRPNSISAYFNLPEWQRRASRRRIVTRALLGRFASALLAGWIVLTAVFFLLRLLPGEPGAAFEDPRVPQEHRQRLRAIYGLDRPLPEQYARWVGGVARGEWGYSLSQHRPVGEILRETAPNTLLLSGAALLVELGLGLALGVAAAARAGSRFDHGAARASLSPCGRCRPSGSD